MSQPQQQTWNKQQGSLNNQASSKQPKNIVVLISGNGSNLQAIIDQVTKQPQKANIAAVISNKKSAYGLVRAQQANIATHVLDHKQFETRESFDQEMIGVIDQYQPDLVVLAGFMRILTDAFVSRYLGRMINVHPSLLPKYPGLNTHSRVLAAKDPVHGASVHFVTSELDGGPLIHQANFRVESNDTPDMLQNKVQQLEHVIYPEVVQWFIDERIQLKDNKALLDDEPITYP